MPGEQQQSAGSDAESVRTPGRPKEKASGGAGTDKARGARPRLTDDEKRKRLDEEKRRKEEEEEKKKLEEEERVRAEQEELQKVEEERKMAVLESQRKEEEKAAAAQKEIEEARQLQAEMQERCTWKQEQRVLNQAAHENRPEEGFFGRLDSSLKKNTAFVKKLRTLTEQQRDSVSSDFNSLNLSKYIGEAVSALVEARLKTSDVGCAVHVCSLFHRRYAEFAPLLLQAWRRHLEARKDDRAAASIGKLRTDLRFIADLTTIAIFSDREGLSLLYEQLKMIVAADRETHAHISVVISFCRHCGEDVVGLVPRKARLLLERHGTCMPRSEIFGPEKQQPFVVLLRDYFSSLSRQLKKDHRELQNLERQNRRILHTKGELSEERHKQHEECAVSYQKLLVSTQSLAELLDETMPDLPEDKSAQEDQGMGIDLFTPGRAGELELEGGLWEDEDSRSFYESLIDLKAFVPAILFKDSEKTGPLQGKDAELGGMSGAEELERELETLEILAEEAEVAAATTDDDASTMGAGPEDEVEDPVDKLLKDDPEPEDEEASVASHLRMIVEAFLQQLLNCVNRDLIDKAATDFCMNMNTKANRRKLVRALFSVPRQRLDLLPFFGRLVATLHPCMPDVAEDLTSMLKSDFKFHVRKKDQINIETKNKTVRFIGELTKFRMFPSNETLYCLKMLLSDFSHHHIEMACTLLETCGRFLFRSPDTHLRTNVLLEQMMRKKQAMPLDERYITTVENAYYHCNPPVVERTVQQARPPVHEYVRRLLYKDLSKVTTERVLRQMRKLAWGDPEVKRYATKCLVSVWNVKYNNIHCVANLLAGLVPFQEDLGVHTVDAVLEDIRLGMEINHPKFNQRRISSAKFLGELYNYRMVESAVVFRTLYSFLTFGVGPDGVPGPLDPPDSLFRIRLVCTLLDTCGQYFNRGSSKRKLDCFLLYFQRYVWWKKTQEIWTATSPFPIDVDYLISDTLELLRPKFRLCASLEEAMGQLAELEREYRSKLGLDGGGGGGKTGGSDVLGGSSSGVADEEDDDDDEEEEGAETEEQSANESDANDQDDEDGTDEEDDEDDEEENTDYMTDSNKENDTDEDGGQVTMKDGGGLKRVACAEDDEFISAFDKMMVENMQQRSSEAVKVHQLDVAIPLGLRGQVKPGQAAPGEPVLEGDTTSCQDIGTMQFVMLTRRGNKQQLRPVSVPITSQLAASRKTQQQAEREERQRVKKLTLDINERQEQEDYQEMLQSLAARPAQANTNRERRPRYVHPKGAPNADLIFKTGGRRR